MDYSKLTDAELDEQAAKCMGWKHDQHCQLVIDGDGIGEIVDWQPSTSPADAFRFMEHALKEHGAGVNEWWGLAVRTATLPEPCSWSCDVRERTHGRLVSCIYAPTLSRAITEALVAAYQAEEGKHEG